MKVLLVHLGSRISDNMDIGRKVTLSEEGEERREGLGKQREWKGGSGDVSFRLRTEWANCLETEPKSHLLLGEITRGSENWRKEWKQEVSKAS